jgi:hypothetical protein
MTNQDTFGAGIFDEEAPIELTAREIAIAKGEDPDAVVDEVENQDGITDESASDAADGGVVEPESKDDAKPVDSKPAEGEQAKSEPVKDGQAEPVAKDEQKEVSEEPDPWAFEKVDPDKFSPDEYDEETIGLVKSLRKTQDTLEQALNFIKTQQQSAQAEAAAKNAKVFHDTLDAMPDEFGVSMKNGQPVKLAPEQEAARLKVRDAAETIYAGLIARKAAVPPVEEIIKQAIVMVNGVARKSADKRQALVEQSAMRRSTGTAAAATRRKPAPPADGTSESIASHPDIDRFWRQAQEANGVY